jgi:uncharacterized protein (DUF362 family)
MAQERPECMALCRSRLIGRRAFLKVIPGTAAWIVSAQHIACSEGLAATGSNELFRVGVGSLRSPYAATMRGVLASGEWPAAAIADQTVLIKPNLVSGRPARSGTTTDPQVVRALVDLALAANARQVLIIEGGSEPPPFAKCGYEFFNTYDPQGRVRLVDLGSEPVVPVDVPNGLAYDRLFVPRLLQEDGRVLISAAKLKCHCNAGVSLSLKNLVAFAAPRLYSVPLRLPRWDLHARGIDESIVDLNLACSVDFAVIDGLWGMQGNGPLFGTPVPLDLVLAGRNALAVDLVALEAMAISQMSVPHLVYAPSAGLGPADMSEINVVGDPFTPFDFLPAPTPPIVWRPVATPQSFSPGQGERTTISYNLSAPCWARVEIVRDSDNHPSIQVVRTLQDWTAVPAGTASLHWDGLGDHGRPVTPGIYLTRVRAAFGPGESVGFATGRLRVA